ncbi:MAG: DUF4886 domain-containing protein [Paludibacter sp.]
MKNRDIKQLLLVIFLLIGTASQLLYSQKTIKILAIGNSFSQDAAESYLDDLAKANGVKLIVANMYIGGCPLDKHWDNASNNKAAYSYRKITNGDTVAIENQTLANAIKDEKWDYITFQQASPLSGISSSFFPYLTQLIQYVKNLSANPKVKFALHQTWAYAANSTHTGFANYNKDQNTMYNAIVNAFKDASTQTGINLIIPSGTAIQNARSSSIGDNLCRDGYHLSLGMGRYTAACTWYEKLTGKKVIGNSFVPRNMSKEEARIAQYAAHYAILKPNAVTSMINFNVTTTLFPDNSGLLVYLNSVEATTF